MNFTLADAIDEARLDPQAARSLFALIRHGCHTEPELERLLDFDELDIPTRDLRNSPPPDPYA